MTNGFDKLLRESLTAEAAADHGAECLDAALVAGWFDGTLSHAERTAVEAHAATCSRCQATIAALVRTDRPVAARLVAGAGSAVAGAGRGRQRGVADCLDRSAPHRTMPIRCRLRRQPPRGSNLPQGLQPSVTGVGSSGSRFFS